tara:strand:+ start:1193 stop:2038 length:846 start_codon:yes stop_codon:yes gene_type:complete
MKIHLCTGLPRSGSTILLNILQQNPRIFTSSTCAVPRLLNDLLTKTKVKEEFISMEQVKADKAMYGFARGAAYGWYEGLTDKPVAFSKSRYWSNLFHLFPESKILVTVRDLRDVVESFEKLENKTLATHTYTSSDSTLLAAMTVEEKLNYYVNQSNPMTLSLRTEIPRGIELFPTKRVMFVRYEDITRAPEEMLKKIYNFIEEPYFDHNLNDISQNENYEHDNVYYAEKISHSTKSVFKYYKEPDRKLPQWFHNQVVSNNPFFYNSFYPDVKVDKPVKNVL